jgi:hypothetical protein
MHAPFARNQRPFGGRAEALERAAPGLFRPMYAGANMGHPSREEGLVQYSKTRCVQSKLKGSRSAGAEETARRAHSRIEVSLHRLRIANRKIRATPRFGIKSTPFFLLRCGANLNEASDTVFSLSVGSKAILLVEARWETAT